MDNHDFIGFVPHRMDIAESVMYHFPQNVLFASFCEKEGVLCMANAVYKPDLESLSEQDDTVSMRYLNDYGGNHWLVISYDSDKKTWKGEKFVNGESIGLAFGSQWNMFFFHFTMLGLANGERYEFEEVE